MKLSYIFVFIIILTGLNTVGAFDGEYPIESVCGNSVCEFEETRNNCPLDCEEIPNDFIPVTSCGLINQPGYYVLQNDISSQGTCLWVSGSGISINLNDHTITYGNLPLVDAPNPGFELGSGSTIIGWSGDGELSTDDVLDDSYSLYMPAGSTITTTDAIPVQPNVQYAFGGMRRNLIAEFQVINPLTDLQIPCNPYIPSTNNRDPWYGGECYVNVGSLLQVKLRIVSPAEDYVDRLYFRQSNVYGISRIGSGFRYYASPTGTLASNLKIFNGNIISGTSKAKYGNALNLPAVSFLEVYSIYSFVEGPDSIGLVAYDGNNKNIHHNYFVSNVSWIINRHYPGNSVVQVQGETSTINNNFIEGGPQEGISISEAIGINTKVFNNVIYRPEETANYANNYAIKIDQPSEVYNNSITGYSRGIHINIYDVSVHDNYINIIDRPNREFRTAMPAHGIKVESSRTRNVLVYNNNVTVGAEAKTISPGPLDVTLDPGANTRIFNNTFRAIKTDAGTPYFTYENYGTSFKNAASDVSSYDDIVVYDNTFISNHVLYYHTGTGYSTNINFTNSRFIRLSPYIQDFFMASLSGDGTINFINSTFVNVNPRNAYMLNSPSQTVNYYVRWFLKVAVFTSDGSPISNAVVTVRNTLGASVSGTTNAQGFFRVLIPEFKNEKGAGSSSIPLTTEYNPYTITVNNAGDVMSRQITLDSSRTEQFMFGVSGTCGNGVLDLGEICDGELFEGGFAPACPAGSCGVQSCSSCTLSTSSCTGYPVADYNMDCSVSLADIDSVSSLRELVIIGRALLFA